MLSYARGPAAPLLDKTIGGVLADSALAHPEREAVIAPGNVRLTYREFHAMTERTARGLAGLGLLHGDRAGVWAANCLEWLLLQYGCAMAGVVLININPAYRSFDLGYVLRKSRLRALFLREQDTRANYRAILEEARAGHELALEHAIYFGEDSWDRMIAGGTDFEPETNSGEVANIQYTSGTTGSPKGVLLTHRNLVNNALILGEWIQTWPEDRICMPLPLYHCAGCVCTSLGTIARGATLILPAPQFDAGATLRAIHAERATVIRGPSIFSASGLVSGGARLARKT